MLNVREIDRVVTTALAEDIGRGDITSQAIIPLDATGAYACTAREAMVACGLEVAVAAFRKLDPELKITVKVKDGTRVKSGTALLTVQGKTLSILAAERVALNLMQRMSAVASFTTKFVDAIKGTKAVILDTRKTTPGLREIEKYAVLMGGARNHRMRLDDGILIKDNHIRAAGGITKAVEKARAFTPVSTRIEVECDTIKQAREAMKAGADMLLLDNMSLKELKEVVSLNAEFHTVLEASGGVKLDNVKAIAETGVHFISVGALTHSVPQVDIGLDEMV